MTNLFDFLSSYAWSGVALFDNGIVGGGAPPLVLLALAGGMFAAGMVFGVLAVMAVVTRWGMGDHE